MAKQNSGELKTGKGQKLSLLDLKALSFQLNEKTLNVEEASDEEFDIFIRQFVDIGWSLEERRDALNTAIEKGALMLPESVESTHEQIEA